MPTNRAVDGYSLPELERFRKKLGRGDEITVFSMHRNTVSTYPAWIDSFQRRGCSVSIRDERGIRKSGNFVFWNDIFPPHLTARSFDVGSEITAPQPLATLKDVMPPLVDCGPRGTPAPFRRMVDPALMVVAGVVDQQPGLVPEPEPPPPPAPRALPPARTRSVPTPREVPSVAPETPVPAPKLHSVPMARKTPATRTRKRHTLTVIGTVFKNQRQNLMLSQAEFAAKLGIGINRVANIELGDVIPSDNDLLALASACSVDLDDLLTARSRGDDFVSDVRLDSPRPAPEPIESAALPAAPAPAPPPVPASATATPTLDEFDLAERISAIVPRPRDPERRKTWAQALRLLASTLEDQ